MTTEIKELFVEELTLLKKIKKYGKILDDAFIDHLWELSMKEALKKSIKDFSFIAPSEYADRLQLMKS